MSLLQTAVIYFLSVFSAAFVLGTVRVLFVVPAIGTRAAELFEIPLVIGVVILAARVITRRRANTCSSEQWLRVGAIALVLTLSAEVGVGVALRGTTVWEALFERDPISGTAYYLALGVFALAPWLFARKVRSTGGQFLSGAPSGK